MPGSIYIRLSQVIFNRFLALSSFMFMMMKARFKRALIEERYTGIIESFLHHHKNLLHSNILDGFPWRIPRLGFSQFLYCHNISVDSSSRILILTPILALRGALHSHTVSSSVHKSWKSICCVLLWSLKTGRSGWFSF